jgi:AcrR family transcriptional regulator
MPAQRETSVPESKKDIILRTAMSLFARKGFKETSMAELAKLTGASEGTIFYHFKNKEEIYLSILKNVKEGLVAEFEKYFAEKEFETGLDMMEGAVLFYLYLSGTKKEQFLLLHHRHPYELATVNRVCREHLEAIYSCILDIFEKAIVLGQQDGSIDEMPARKTALIIFSMVDGLVRFDTYNVYHAASLCSQLIESCRRMLRRDS